MLFLLALINIFGCMVLTRIYKNCRGFLFWLAPAFLPLYVAVIANIFPAPGKMVAFALMLVFLKCTVSWERMPGRQVFLYELLLGRSSSRESAFKKAWKPEKSAVRCEASMRRP